MFSRISAWMVTDKGLKKKVWILPFFLGILTTMINVYSFPKMPNPMVVQFKIIHLTFNSGKDSVSPFWGLIGSDIVCWAITLLAILFSTGILKGLTTPNIENPMLGRTLFMVVIILWIIYLGVSLNRISINL